MLVVGTVKVQVLAFGVTFKIAYCDEDPVKLPVVARVSEVFAVREIAFDPAIAASSLDVTKSLTVSPQVPGNSP